MYRVWVHTGMHAVAALMECPAHGRCPHIIVIFSLPRPEASALHNRYHHMCGGALTMCVAAIRQRLPADAVSFIMMKSEAERADRVHEQLDPDVGASEDRLRMELR